MTGHEHGLEYIVLNKKKSACHHVLLQVYSTCTWSDCMYHKRVYYHYRIRLYMYIVHVLGLIVKTKGVLSLYEYYDQQKL